MNWKELNKKSLKKIMTSKLLSKKFIVSNDEGQFEEQYEYDILEYLDLEGCGMTDEEMKKCFHSLHCVVQEGAVLDRSAFKEDHYFEYEFDEVLEFFTHYCLLTLPKDDREKK